MTTISRITNSINAWAILALYTLLPIFFIPLPWTNVAQGKMLLAAVLIAVAAISWFVGAYLEGHVQLPLHTAIVVGVLIPLAYAVSSAMTGFAPYSIVGTGIEQDTLVAAILSYAALVMSALFFSEHPLRSAYVLRGFFIGTGILALFVIAHVLFPAGTSLGGLFVGQLANPFGGWYELGIFFGITFFLALALLSTSVAAKKWKILFIVVAVCTGVVLVIINIVAVWIAVSIVSTLALCIRAYGEGGSVKGMREASVWRPHQTWLAAISVSLFFIFFGGNVNTLLPPSLQIGISEVRPSWQGTWAIGRHSLSQTTPLIFGVGPNGFTGQWALYKPVEVNATQFWNADFNAGIGMIPTSFITTGILGGFAWILFILALLLGVARLSILESREYGAHGVISMLLLAVLFCVAFEILYVPGPALSLLLFLLFGLALGLSASVGLIAVPSIRLRDGGWTSHVSLAMGAIAVFFVCFASANTARAVLAEMLVNDSVASYNASGNLAQSSELLSLALHIYPRSDRGQRAAVELGILELQQLASTAPTDPAAAARLQQGVQDTIKHALAAVLVGGNDYQDWLELASLYQQLAGAQVQGAYENAQSAYENAMARNPTNPLPYLAKAQLALIKGDKKGALNDIQEAITRKSDFAAAHYLASQIYISEGDFTHALPAAVQTAQIAQNDPLAWYNLGIIAYASGDYGDAAAALEHALSLQPQYANARYALGLSYYKLGRTSDALSSFQTLDKVAPNQPAVQQVIANLQSGKAPLPEPTPLPTPSPAKKAR